MFTVDPPKKKDRPDFRIYNFWGPAWVGSRRRSRQFGSDTPQFKPGGVNYAKLGASNAVTKTAKDEQMPLRPRRSCLQIKMNGQYRA